MLYLNPSTPAYSPREFIEVIEVMTETGGGKVMSKNPRLVGTVDMQFFGMIIIRETDIIKYSIQHHNIPQTKSKSN